MYLGSPDHWRSSSPIPSRKDIEKVADDKRKRDDDRNQSGGGDESHKLSDRQSFRTQNRYDDHSRRDRHVDDYDRGYSKSSYRSSRDPRDNSILDYSRSDKEHRSRDHVNETDTHSRGKPDGSGHRSRDKDSYDRAGSGRRHAIIDEKDRDKYRDDRGDRYGKSDHKKSSGDHRSDRSPAYEESRGQRNDPSARRDGSGYRLKEASWRDAKAMDSGRHANDEKRRDDDLRACKEQGNKGTKEHSDDLSLKGEDAIAKKPKILDSTGPGTDGLFHYNLSSNLILFLVLSVSYLVSFHKQVLLRRLM